MKTILENIWRVVSGAGVHGEWLAIKSVVILALALGLMRLWRKGSASARHWGWVAVFGCLLCLPALEQWAPTWQAPAWVPVAGLNVNEPQAVPIAFSSPTVMNTAAVAPAGAAQMAAVTETKSGSIATESTVAPMRAVPWGAVAMMVWLAGVLGFGLHWMAGRARLWWASRQWKEWNDPVAAVVLNELRVECKIGRRVKLLTAETGLTPATWGWWRPVVAMPEAAAAWPEERLRVVLRHELAHVKRGDWLMQELSHVVCGLYWFNPLAWMAARWMRADREAACDDLVLNAGEAPVNYAEHLVEIARQFTRQTQLNGAVAMARASGLEQRVTAILDGRRNRRPVAAVKMAVLVLTILSVGTVIGSYGQGTKAGQGSKRDTSPWSGVSAGTMAHLKDFVAAKAAQAAALEQADEKERLASDEPSQHNLKEPDLQPFFTAAAKGDWLAVTNEFAALKSGMWNGTTNRTYYHGKWMQPVLETYGAVEAFANGAGKYAEIFGGEIIRSMPAGSIYFGGTDAGRFVVTAMSASHAQGDPVFTLTQNALADQTYDSYLKTMYEGRIQLPALEDMQKAFQEYADDIKARSERHELKPGEQYNDDQSGRVQIGGVVAVMQINGLLVKDIFEWNTNRDFYVEQSYPLDWMYPYFEPHGLIFKLNRQPVATISEAMVKENNDYWATIIAGMIGDWDDYTPGQPMPVSVAVGFGRKVFDAHDLNGFKGDGDFVQSKYASKAFAKLRESQAGLYVWRMNHTESEVEKDRMARAADLAFKQALVLYPHLPETVEDYTNFLMSVDRVADAKLVADLKPVSLQLRLVDDASSADNEMLILSSQMPVGGTTYEKLYVERQVLLDQSDVASASAAKTESGNWMINVDFSPAGKQKFADITGANINRRLAILLDGKVWSVPTIRSQIPNGSAQITGNFTEQEAKGLADKLNNQ